MKPELSKIVREHPFVKPGDFVPYLGLFATGLRGAKRGKKRVEVIGKENWFKGPNRAYLVAELAQIGLWSTYHMATIPVGVAMMLAANVETIYREFRTGTRDDIAYRRLYALAGVEYPSSTELTEE